MSDADSSLSPSLSSSASLTWTDGEVRPSPLGLEGLEGVTQYIRHRRSIKPVDMDAGRTVERELLLALLENANQAPTHGLTEPWRFHILQGEARRELAGVMQEIYREITPAAEFREEKVRKMAENPVLAPVVIVIVMARRGGVKVPEVEEVESVACAVQNLHLSVSAAGLAGYWSSPPLLYERKFAHWLGLGAEDRCLGLFYLGWPRRGLVWPQAVRRGPVAEKVVWRGEQPPTAG
jgi:nitroreductase